MGEHFGVQTNGADGFVSRGSRVSSLGQPLLGGSPAQATGSHMKSSRLGPGRQSRCRRSSEGRLQRPAPVAVALETACKKITRFTDTPHFQARVDSLRRKEEGPPCKSERELGKKKMGMGCGSGDV